VEKKMVTVTVLFDDFSGDGKTQTRTTCSCRKIAHCIDILQFC
jgi:hypothetical protein